MIRGSLIRIVLCFSVLLVGSPGNLLAHGGGGHGGGGGHMGGGHMGGGHSMGSMHSGHSMGSYHSGHVGGYQHMGTQHMGTHQNYNHIQNYGHVQQHMNGVQNSIQNHSYGIQHNSSLNGVHQNLTNSSVNQHFNSQHLGSQNFGNQHHSNSTFLQNHALHNNSTVNNSTFHQNLNHTNSLQNHNSSQFLSQHSLQNGSALQQHNANFSHNLSGQTNHLSSNFLSSHHVSNVSSLAGSHHASLLGNQGSLHHNQLSLNHNFQGNAGFHNHQYLHSGGNWGNHWHGYGYGNRYGYGNYWRYPYFGYGYGFPYYGYGLGFGLGYGLGYGFGLGGLGFYSGYGLGYYGLGYGYGGYGYGGYGGYGYGGYGYGLNGYGYCLNGYGYGSNYGYPGWGCTGYLPNCAYVGYGYPAYGNYAGYGVANGLASSGLAYAPLQMNTLGVATATDAGPAVVPSTVAAKPDLDTTSGAASGLPTAEQFARIGETAFRARDYKGAVRAWRHGLVDDPQNAVLVMMLSQALLATEQYSESAGAVQSGMQMLPEDKWDVVIKNFRDLYGKGEDYTAQIRTLEKAAREKPEEPSLRFLLGYHYGFLGYPAEAVKQLEKCVSLAPRDEVAQKVLRLFDSKLPKKDVAPGPGQPPESTLQDVPVPLDNLIPPPPLNPDPANAQLKTANTEPASAAQPANSTP